MILFVLSGWSGSGKDTVASLLQPMGFIRYAFADVLKEIVAKEYGFPVQWTHTQQGKQQQIQSAGGKTVRELLIQRGQEIRFQEQTPDYFAKIVAEKIQRDNHAKVVITDWRFQCELSAIQQNIQHNAYIYPIRVVRDGQETSYVNDAYTEHELDTFPFVYEIHNPGTSMTELHKCVRKFVTTIINDEKELY